MSAKIAEIEQFSSETVSRTLSVIERSIENYDFKEGNFLIKNDNVVINAIQLDGEELDGSMIGGSERGNPPFEESKKSFFKINRQLTKELKRQKRDEELVKVTTVEYLSPKMFTAADESSDGQKLVLSNVLSVSVKSGKVGVSSLENELEIVNIIKAGGPGLIGNIGSLQNSSFVKTGVYKRDDTKFTVDEKCVFWDFDTKNWSSKGCRKVVSNINGNFQQIQCFCNHMTHFAVILDIEEDYAPKYMDLVTLFGCSISFSCILLTITVVLYFRELHSKLSHRILLMICTCVLFIDIIFMAGIDNTENESNCLATAFLLHYSVLALWSSLLVEGCFLFYHLVWSRINRGFFDERTFFRCALVVCFGIPLLEVTTVYGSYGSDNYISSKYCWLSTWPMLFSVVIPVALVLLLNSAIFVLCLYYITCGRKMLSNSDKTSWKENKKSLKRAACMVSTLGLPWIFGYLMLLSTDPDAKRVFSVLFSLINSLQGVLIFVFYIATQPNVKELIAVKLLNVKKKQILSSHKISSSYENKRCEKSRSTQSTGLKTTAQF